MNLVTVIVPTYNTSKYIKKCIDSILNQTFKNIELIVIDDGSTDNTKDIIEKVNDKRLKYVYKENGGVSSARNLGIDLSTGNYIMFVDSDDYIDKDFIEVVHNYATKTECDIVRCGYRNVSLDGKVLNEVKSYFMNVKGSYIVYEPFVHPETDKYRLVYQGGITTIKNGSKSGTLVENVNVNGYSCLGAKCSVTIENVDGNSENYSLGIDNSDFFSKLGDYKDYIKLNIYYNQSSVSNNVQKIIFKTLKLKHVMSHQVKNISKM